MAEIRALGMSEAEIRAAGALQLTEEEELELLEQKVARIKAGGKS